MTSLTSMKHKGASHGQIFLIIRCSSLMKDAGILDIPLLTRLTSGLPAISKVKMKLSVRHGICPVR